uniref:Peptidoglycan binding-like domain-containing protein n=1 Tax=Terrapene triunguis TaxID=2587831 RepID=A0A674IDX5_9SAUR
MNTNDPKHCSCFCQNYLRNFYQLETDKESRFKNKNVNSLTEKLEEMQAFFGLKVTGKPDVDTLEVMKKPRCGVPDIGQYVLTDGNPKWERKNLTYRYQKVYIIFWVI